MTAEARRVGECGRCGAPLYVRIGAGVVAATVEWSCGHGPGGA